MASSYSLKRSASDVSDSERSSCRRALLQRPFTVDSSDSENGDDEKMPHGSARFVDRLQAFFGIGKCTDLSVSCGARVFKVHRTLLSLHSEVFEKMLHGGFKEEGLSNIILPDDDPTAIEMIIRYVYSFKYGHSSRDTLGLEPDPLALVQHMRVGKTADKYAIPELVSLALRAFKNDVATHIGSAAFADAVAEAYDHDGYEQFKESLLEVASSKLYWLDDQPDRYPAFWTAAESVPKFSADLLRQRGKEVRLLRRPISMREMS